MSTELRLVAILLGLTTGCATTVAWRTEARVGISDDRLADLLERHWAWTLEEDPTTATELGVRDFDDRVGARDEAAIAESRAQARALRAELAAMAPLLTVPADRTSAELLLEALDAKIEAETCQFHRWSISASRNPVAEWNYLPELHAVKTDEDAKNLVLRYHAIAGAVDEDVKNLRAGLAEGRVANAESVGRVIAMVKTQLEAPRGEWPLVSVAKSHPGLAELAGIVDAQIQPALARYLALLEGEIAPRARPSTATGLGALPDGAACYRAQIRRFTGLPLDPAETHRLGLEEIARLDREIAALGEKALQAKDLPTTLTRLRSDPSLYFTTAEEIEQAAQRYLDRANAAVPRYFGILPKAPCVISRIPDYEAPYSTIAYYRQPVPDGSKPGQYFVNVHKPEVRPRFEAAVLAFHESVPGHHLQIAIAQERSALPAFRKHFDATAFIEGWALYTERLAEEMGLYESDLDRLGMLSFDAWRASRLVVDTGIHAMGWSREQAVEFMLAHTALSETNIRNEVDRYIVWPAQALAYKTGQRELLRLRAEAQAKMGPRFSLPAFHDVVLGQGAVSLPVLARAVEAWSAAP